MKRIYLYLGAALLGLPATGLANPALEIKVNELSQIVMELQKTVAAQQQEINLLKAAKDAGVPAGKGQEQAAAAPSGRPSSAAAGRWNPDIGVIADTLFTHDSGKTDADGADRVSVRDLELVMGSYVDPYSRLDVNIGFSDFEDVHIEEAYLTRFGLPLETTARIGRFKPKAGKSLLAHRDILETVDYPLVVQRYFGHDGFSRTGVDFTAPLDLPLDSAHEISAGILEGGNGEDGTVFGDSRRRPTIYSHVKNFWDLSDVTNFELGGTHMLGSSDEDAGIENNILGVDGTLIHYYGPDQRIKLQSELFYLNQQESLDENRFGTYGLLDVKFHRRWSAGLRFDFAQLVNRSGIGTGGSDKGYAGYITFFQTEFARWRLQYNHIESPDGQDDNQFFIQGIFAIGEHKHKLQ